ncbi:MAG TPA: caspase family protein [Sphaerochaeta sp.]|nr:caspase family protein [Sphaerochaeta sp.]HOQ93688.1 caspase family protein [Sphaerochaeta sp.]HPK47530.1 caspase family protein [Sphaerochaeta sp.]
MKRLLISSLLLVTLLCSCELFPCDEGRIVHMGIGLSYHGLDVQVLPATINDAVELSLAFFELFEDRAFSSELLVQRGVLDDQGLWAYEGGSSPSVPTKKRILERLEHWITSLDATDLLIISYSGHGLEDGSLVLAPGDGVTIFSSEGTVDISLLLAVDELFSLLSQSRAAVFLILDSCYSGNFVRDGDSSISVVEGREIFEDAYRCYFSDASYGRTVFVLSATSRDHTSSEPIAGSHTHGYFTAALLEGLGWECAVQCLALRRPFISSDWLYTYILSHQRIPTSSKFSLWYQHPHVSGGPLDLVLVK